MSKKVSLREKIEHEAEDLFTDVEDFIQEKWHHKLHRHAQHHVHRLRQKPTHHKQVVAFAISFSVTAFVFVLWYVFSVPRIMQSYQTAQKQNSRLEVSANPIEEIKDMYNARKNTAEVGAAIELQ